MGVQGKINQSAEREKWEGGGGGGERERERERKRGVTAALQCSTISTL